MNLYDLARQITDRACGPGAYAKLNKGNPDPGMQKAIRDSEREAKKISHNKTAKKRSKP